MSRETVLAALAQRIGARRAPWPEMDETDSAPYTLLIDGAETVTRREYGEAYIDLQVEVWRTAKAGDDQRATAASGTLETLIAQIYGTDPTLGGECLGMRYAEGNTFYPADGTDLVGAAVSFVLEYARPE
jgi:hypothetical protein